MIRRFTIALAFLLFASAAARADGLQSAEAAAKAAQELDRYMDAAAKANTRPVFAKPPASDYLARILDAQALAALPPPQGKDINWMLKWAEAMNKVNQTLIFVGAQSGSEADRRAAIERNMNDYEDVMFPAWAFMARMQVRLITTADLFWDALPLRDRTPARKNGLTKIRDGHMQFVGGALTTIAAGIKPANAHTLTAALRETAPLWVPLMNAGEQGQLRSSLDAARKTYQDKAVLDDLEGLSLMIETTKSK